MDGHLTAHSVHVSRCAAENLNGITTEKRGEDLLLEIGAALQSGRLPVRQVGQAALRHQAGARHSDEDGGAREKAGLSPRTLATDITALRWLGMYAARVKWIEQNFVPEGLSVRTVEPHGREDAWMRTVQRLVRQACEELGIEPIGTHGLRATAAQTLYDEAL